MSEYKLYPYDGKNNISEQIWNYVWHTIEEDKLKDIVFVNGSIVTFFDFLTLVKTKALPTLVLDEASIPVATGWLTDVSYKSAFAHFLFFKHMWGNDSNADIGNMMLDFWFNKLNLNLIIGIIPEKNKLALNYIKQLGFISHDTIPHLIQSEDGDMPGVFSYITKEDFNGRR